MSHSTCDVHLYVIFHSTCMLHCAQNDHVLYVAQYLQQSCTRRRQQTKSIIYYRSWRLKIKNLKNLNH